MKRLITPTTLIAALVCASTALAHTSTVHVAGIQAPPDTTAGAPGDPCAAVDPETGHAPVVSNAMAGSLVGCWYTDTSNLISSTPTGVIHTTGAEHFVGCLNIRRHRDCNRADQTGTLALTYTFEAQFDPVTPHNEIWGHCEHRILSGTGRFRGATGQIDFKDNVTNGTSVYRGHITFADRRGAARATASAAAAAVSQPTSMC